MALNETISTGNKYRRLKDASTKLWQRLSFWTKASDVEFDNGATAEASLGNIQGITDSLNSNSSTVAASAAAVNTLNSNLTTQTGRINVYVGSDSKLHFVNRDGADTALNFSISSGLHKSEKIASVGSQPFNFNSEYGETNGNAEFIVDVSAYVGRGLPRITFILESAAHFTATWDYTLGDHSRSVGSPTYNLVGTALHIYCPYNCACSMWGSDKRASGIWTSCDVYCMYIE